jgi:hypothetical protein
MPFKLRIILALCLAGLKIFVEVEIKGLKYVFTFAAQTWGLVITLTHLTLKFTTKTVKVVKLCVCILVYCRKQLKFLHIV